MKKIISIALALVLCVGILPMSAQAWVLNSNGTYVYNGQPRKVQNFQLTLDGVRVLKSGEDFTITKYTDLDGNEIDCVNVGPVLMHMHTDDTTIGALNNGQIRYDIVQAPLTITGLSGGSTKEYDGNTDCDEEGLVIAFDGKCGEDDVAIKAVWGTCTYSDPNAGTDKEITLSGATYELEGDKAGNYYIADNPPDTLTASVGTISKANYPGTKAAATSTKKGAAASYDLTPLVPKGATLGTPTTSSEIFDGTPAVSGSTLSYKLKDTASTDSSGTITVPVTSLTNYNDFSLTVTVTVTEKDVPTLAVNPITVTYTGKAVPDSAITGTATVLGQAVEGTWAFAENQTLTNVVDSGEKIVIFKPDDAQNYAEATGTVVVTINMATPTGAPKYTAITASGKTLADAGLTSPEGWPQGDLVWDLPSETAVTANTEYAWTFTPTDAANYNVLTGKIKLWEQSSGGSSGGTTIPPKQSVTTDTTQNTTQTTATPTTTTQGGTATATVSTTMGNEIVKQAVANRSEAVVIAPKTGNATKTEVSIPAATVGQIGTQTSASLTVSTSVADVTIPNGGLGSLASAGGTVTVTAQQVGNAVELTVTAGGEIVESIPGGLTLTVPATGTTPGTVAMLVREDGTREVVRKSVADEKSVTIPLDGSAKLVIVDNSKTFDDVPADSWAADAVAFASAHELFNGTAPGRFSPNTAMSRGMLAVVLHNLESNPEQALTDIFGDVDNNQWYAEGVAWAAEQGIVGGYGNGQFGPNDPITREQLATMLWRYAGEPKAAGAALAFTDADKVSDYAKAALLWASENGVINGKGSGILDPKGPATRAQVAQMLKNFMK